MGRISHESLRELGRLADEYGSGAIRLTTGQNAIFVNIPEERLDALLSEPLLRELPPEPSRFFRGLVACTGTDYCNLAQIDTKGRAVQISKALEERLGADGKPITIHWSGCPAGCGNHQAADIGLRGMKVNVEGRSLDAVAIYVGGRTGPQARAGGVGLGLSIARRANFRKRASPSLSADSTLPPSPSPTCSGSTPCL